MKSRITKLAAAAVIIVAVLIIIHELGGSVESVAFADVVRPILAVETGRFKMTIDVVSSGLDWIDHKGEPTQTIEIMFAGPGRTRWNVPTGEVLVANMHEGKVMILSPAKKQAAVMQVCPPGVIPRHNRFNKLFELRRLIQYALESEDESVEFLGEQKINGVTAIGYRITGHGDITIWANAKTKLPIQIEQSIGAETVIINDITYDIGLEESLFSVEPPKGYSVADPGEDKQPSFVVRGTVTDAVTGEPIAGAKVSDDQYAGGRQGAITDSEGKYRYLTWPEEHSIKVEAQGYKPQRKGITGLFHAETEDEKVIDFALERGYTTLKLVNSCEPVYGSTNPSPEQKANAEVRRFGSVIVLLPEKEKLYRELHADVWPEVIAALKKANVQNFNIFLLELEGKKYLFSYLEYAGDDLYQDFAGIADDPTVREKWDPITDACEKRLPGTPKGEQWKSLEMLMHLP
ncbi:MAG: L-rhamnose mutarotase [Planctomycetota bacterium]